MGIINHRGCTFRLQRIASGGGISGVGGSYPLIEFYTSAFPKFIVGNELSKKYTKGSFLLLPPHENFAINGLNLFSGSEDSSLMAKIKETLSKNTKLAEILFKSKFSHLTISSRIDVCFSWRLLQKKYVVQYIGLPEHVSKSPAEMNFYLDAILEIHSELEKNI